MKVRSGSLALPLLLAGLAFPPAAAAPSCSPPRFSAPIRAYAPVGGDSGDLVTGDFDGDGRTDVAALDTGNDLLVLVRRAPQGGLLPARVLGPGGLHLRAADVDGDGVLDLLVLRATELQAFFPAHPSSAEGPRTPVVLPSLYATALAAADFDGDGHVDVAVLCGIRNLQLMRGDGRGGLGPAALVPVPGNAVGNRLEAADFDGDGHADLALVPGFRDTGVLLSGDGHGAFAVKATFTGLNGASSVVADFNGDGLPDLAMSGTLAFGGSVFLMAGSRTLGLTCCAGTLPFPSLPPPPTGLAAADFDGDGRLDLIVAGALGHLTFLQGDGRGGFASTAQLANSTAERVAALETDLVTETPGGAVELWQGACGSTRPDLVVPALVSLDGVGGTHFESELTLANRGSSTVSIELSFGEARATMALPPGQRTFAPAVDALRAAGLAIPAGPVTGALALRVMEGSPLDVAAEARTTSRVPGASGTGGVAYPAVSPAQTNADTVWIPWLAEDAGNRTNLAMLHAGSASDGPITLNIVVTPTAGEDIGIPAASVLTLSAGDTVQWNRVLAFMAPGATRGYARIDRVEGAAPFVAYAVVNDAATGDGSYVAAVPDQLTLASRVVLEVPAIVENARYESELVLTNLGGAPRRLEATWRPAGFDPITVTLDVAPGGQLEIPCFVQHLRDLQVGGVPPRGADLAGALELRSASGELSGLLAGARTTTAGSPERFGVYTPAADASHAAVSRAWVFGLRQDESVRSNLALVNLSSAAMTLTLYLHRGSDGAGLGLYGIRIGAGEWLQLGSVLAQAGLRDGYAEILGNSIGPILAYGVVNEGAQPGLGSGDGSYLAMQPW